MSGTPLPLAVRPPFDGVALLAWLAARAVPGVEEVSGDVYRRVLRHPAGTAVLRVELGADRAAAGLEGPPASAAVTAAAAAAVAALVDAAADPAAIGAVLGADPVLRPLVRARPGLRCPGTVDPGELALRAVLGQQVSVAAARTLAGRLAADHGVPVEDPSGGGLRHAFPSAAAIAALHPDDLPMPRARGRTLTGLAAALAAGRVVLAPGADAPSVRAALVALPGIGPWTADYVAMRALGDRDAFPATDLVVRRAARALGLPGPTADLVARAEAWRPYRAYATHHLWASGAA